MQLPRAARSSIPGPGPASFPPASFPTSTVMRLEPLSISQVVPSRTLMSVRAVLCPIDGRSLSAFTFRSNAFFMVFGSAIACLLFILLINSSGGNKAGRQSFKFWLHHAGRSKIDIRKLPCFLKLSLHFRGFRFFLLRFQALPQAEQ